MLPSIARQSARRTLAIALWAAFALLPGSLHATENSAGCAAPPAGTGEYKIDVGGTERRFFVIVPQDYDGKTPRPVVVGYHGFGQSVYSAGPGFGVQLFWPETIAVFPEGLTRKFPGIYPTLPANVLNMVGPGWQVTPDEFGARDIAFFDAMRKKVVDAYCVDLDRFYLLGTSNGAFLSHLIACARPDDVSAIAAAGGGARCKPKKPVPVILFHGTEDPIVPFQEAVDADRTWGRENGCRAQVTPYPLACIPRRPCDGAAVVFCADGGGHHYELSFTQRAVEFFKEHPRAAPQSPPTENGR